MTVWMRHPNLPDGRVIEAEEKQVPHYQASGWVINEDKEAVPTAPKRRRAATEEND